MAACHSVPSPNVLVWALYLQELAHVRFSTDMSEAILAAPVAAVGLS